VGSIANTSPVLTGTSTTLSDDPETVGDVLVLLVHIVNSTATVSTVLGGGASGWAVDQQFSDFFGATQHDTEIWQGEVSSTGPSAITVRFSPSLAGTNVDVVAQEFTAGLGSATTWSQDGGAGQSNLSSSAVDYPSLTPSGSGELYFGYAWVPGTASAGSTPGVTYDVTFDGNLICFDPSVSAELTPAGLQDADVESASIAVLIKAS
jgi:hypothetical protein